MPTSLTSSTESYLLDWGITLAAGGGICLIFGFFIGWIIWKNTRKFAQKVEDGNRTAFADFERTSDEISKIKSELADGERPDKTLSNPT